jgi:hypothetical protein
VCCDFSFINFSWSFWCQPISKVKQVIKELYKVIALIVSVGLFITFFYAFGSLDEPVAAKANRIVEEGKNLSKSLTKKERDEYMEYLRALNDSDEKIYQKSIYQN